MLELLTLPFFQRALLVGLIVGILMAILGVLVVLRRMSFFSDAIGHSALTGIAIGILLNADPFIAGLIFALIIAAAIVVVRYYTQLHLDTLLGVFFPAAMALGVILLRFSSGFQTDLVAFLFGDILTVSSLDIVTSLILAVIVTIMMIVAGKRFISMTVDEALAHSEGIHIVRHELLLIALLAAVIALAIKLVGIILVTAMIVIPAASAQNIARSLTSMFIISAVIGLIAVVVGMLISAAAGWPSGPTIVLTTTLLFALSFSLKLMKVQL